jgi:hypothetical protein
LHGVDPKTLRDFARGHGGTGRVDCEPLRNKARQKATRNHKIDRRRQGSAAVAWEASAASKSKN